MTVYSTLLTLQQNINKAASGDCILDGQGQVVWLKEAAQPILPAGVILQNITFKSAALVGWVMFGDYVRMYNVKHHTYGYSGADPIIALVESTRSELRNVYIDGDNTRKAIFCNTTASDIIIDDVEVAGNIGWGILVNDSEVEQGKGYRTYGGKSYADQPIGSNWVVHNFRFGKGLTNPARTGDGLEFNTPDMGMMNVFIDNVQVDQTFTTGANSGIGAGFANVTNLVLDNITVKNATKFGLHCEKGKNHRITNFRTENCERALSVSHTENTTYDSGVCMNSAELLTSYNRLDAATTGYGPGNNLVVNNVKFDGCTRQGIVLANMENSQLTNLSISGYSGNPKGALIKMYREDTNGVRKSVDSSVVENITFNRGTGTVEPEVLVDITGGTGNVLGAIHSRDYAKRVRIEGNLIHL